MIVFKVKCYEFVVVDVVVVRVYYGFGEIDCNGSVYCIVVVFENIYVYYCG